MDLAKTNQQLDHLTSMDALADPRAVHDQLRMLPAEGFGNVAIPANGIVSRQHIRNCFGSEIRKFNGLTRIIQQSRLVIKHMSLAQLTSAGHAILSRIPTRKNFSYETIFGR